jgi:hypothetical protein
MGRKVNFILQGKGGVGKSFVAFLLAQHFGASEREDVVCVDTDPVNATFWGYKSFRPRRIELLNDGVIDTGRFDELIMWIISEDADLIIDNGASCFVPLTKYLFESNALGLILGAGRDVIFHSVLTGSSGLKATVGGFDLLAAQMPTETKMVVWLNEFFGPVEAGGKKFEEMQVYQRHQDRITAVLTLPKQNEQTFGRDLQALLDNRLTFAQAKASPDFTLVAKQRIAMMEKQLLDQLKLVA